MQDHLTVQVNGEQKLVPPATTVSGLLNILAVRPERVAVEVNRQIVKKADWSQVPLREGDRVEVVQFVGGG
jgi:sulfur carrier protein